MLKKTGVATSDLIQGVCPDENRRKKGAFAVIECFQKIPCDPCKSACMRGAINMAQINDIPKADFDKCNGCGVCVAVCPGLAIFIIDETYSDTQALIKLPYEFLPLPAAGDVVDGVDREGKPVCKATVKQVTTLKTGGKTPVVAIIVPKEFSMVVRGINLDGACAAGEEECAAHNCGCVKIQQVNDKTSGDAYICRCEEITIDKLREYIAKGYTTLNEIKIASRAGMGACQGRTCRQLILNELSKVMGQKIENMPVSTLRPPVKPIKMALLLNEEDSLDDIIASDTKDSAKDKKCCCKKEAGNE